MLSNEPHAEARPMHLGGARRVAEPRRWLRHGAQRLVLRGPGPQGPALAGPVDDAAAPETVAFAHAAVRRGKMVTTTQVVGC